MVSVQDLTAPGRTTVMGIVNVTEDSFSDGGKWLAVDDALSHAHELVRLGADIIDVGAESTRPGADIIDVGAESTRPGATRVPAEVEAARVVPVIRALHEDGIRTSVDTMRAATADAAAEAGVDLINDVSGGLADPDMYATMARTDLPVCLMHWRAQQFVNASGAADHGGDVVADVLGLFDELVANATVAGVRPEQITLDPGFGFAKTPQENWQLLQALPALMDCGYPLLVGASRKRFLRGVRAARGLEHGPIDADPATAAVTALCAQAGAWCVRVHEVAVSRDAVDVAAAWKAGNLG